MSENEDASCFGLPGTRRRKCAEAEFEWKKIDWCETRSRLRTKRKRKKEKRHINKQTKNQNQRNQNKQAKQRYKVYETELDEKQKFVLLDSVGLMDYAEWRQVGL